MLKRIFQSSLALLALVAAGVSGISISDETDEEGGTDTILPNPSTSVYFSDVIFGDETYTLDDFTSSEDEFLGYVIKTGHEDSFIREEGYIYGVADFRIESDWFLFDADIIAVYSVPAVDYHDQIVLDCVDIRFLFTDVELFDTAD